VGFFEEDELLRGEHRKRLGLSQGHLDFVAVSRKTGDGPGASGFGNEAIDELAAASVAEVRFVTKEKNRRDGSSLFETREEFAGGDLRHQKFSRTAATSFCAKSFARRSSAGSCSSKKVFTSVESSYSLRKRKLSE